MYLKWIKILGFKSFADSTLLEFHPGITAVVGPNGCGKSNISDAFRWVLGEQSAKSMRGHKMQDVIFSGTEKRKALNLSEVTIALAEAGDALQTDYDEVAVTRRVHRSGESDYLINKRPVRLKDVTELFLDSGIGKNAFSIFEQGKIEQVIQLSPLERRCIFEEAAGILRFLHRKKEALRRLEQTEGNLERIRDIHREVEKRITVLEAQAVEAKHYQENRLELEKLEISLAFSRWSRLKEQRESLASQEEKKKRGLKEAVCVLEKMEQQRQVSALDLQQAVHKQQAMKEEVFKAGSQKEVQVKGWQSQKERIEEMGHQEREWVHALEEMKEKRGARQKEAGDVKGKEKGVADACLRLEQRRSEQREYLNAVELRVSVIRDQQHALQQEKLCDLREEKRIESELKQAMLKLEHREERVRRLQENQQVIQERLAKLSIEISSKGKEAREGSKALSNLKEKEVFLEGSIEKMSSEAQEEQEKLRRVCQELTELSAREQALIRLRDAMDGFSKGTKQIVQEAARKGSHLYGKVQGLYEDFPVDACDQRLLSAVMKQYAETLVVKTLEDFKAVASFAKEKGVGGFSLLCLEMLPDQAAASGMGDHPIFHRFFHEIIVRPSVGEIWDAGRGEVWTEDGAYLNCHHVVFFPAEREENVFVREAELKSLRRKIKERARKKEKQEADLQKLFEKRKLLMKEKNEVDRAVRQMEVKQAEYRYALERMEADQGKHRLEIEKEQAETLSLQQSCFELRQSLEDLQEQQVRQREQSDERHRQVEAHSKDLQERLEGVKREREEMAQREAAYQKAVDEKRKIAHQLHLFEVQDSESLQQQRRLEEEISTLQEKKARMRQSCVEDEQKIEQMEQALLKAREQCAASDRGVQDRRLAVEEIEQKIASEREAVHLLEEEVHAQGIQLAQIDSGRQSLEIEFTGRFQLSMEEAKIRADPLEESVEKAERKIRLLRRKVEEAGAINMAAIEEFGKNQERYGFLSKQIADLTASKEELVEIIAKLDGESRKIFKETFQKIQANFRKNFEILFGGGEADLQFTESGDILEAGVEIAARPPGKKMRAISLMSGGEKCLTAVALLFAIFEVKPSPFCILDEIDAPLDDANVDRFLNLVKTFAKTCQFILITHNKRTMSIADRLFGISMQEKGVSKVLSLEFDRKEAREPVLV